MKSIFCFLLLTFSVAQLQAQSTQILAGQIEYWFNRQEADSIYLQTDSMFQSKISKTGFSNIMQAQLFPYGKITKREFIKTLSSGVDQYKVYLEKNAVLQMLLKINSANQIGGLVFKSWQEEKAPSAIDAWTDNGLRNKLDSLIHAIAQSYLKTHNVPGMSVLVLDQQKANYYNYGWAREETMQHPTPQTLYEIGSITKTFTAYLLADAVIRKKANLDDAIIQYLPDSVAENKQLKGITLANLSNHTSGLPRLPDNLLTQSTAISDPYAVYSNSMLFSYLKNAKTNSKPGEKYAYSNLAVGLLGVILENIYQKPLETLYQEIIFKPFKMKSSFSTTITDSDLVAAPYISTGRRTNYWNFKSMAAAGAIKTNLTDLAMYALQFTLRPRTRGQINPRLALLDSISFDNEVQRVSLGWHFNKASGNDRRMEHAGGTMGFRTYLGICPNRKLAVAVFMNAAEDPGAPAVGEEIFDKLLTTETKP